MGALDRDGLSRTGSTAPDVSQETPACPATSARKGPIGLLGETQGSRPGVARVVGNFDGAVMGPLSAAGWQRVCG